MTTALQALSLVEKAEPVQVRFTLRSKDRHSMWMQDGCKVYMVSYIASNGSCFMVTWTIFKSHLFGVGLNTNWEQMALRTLTIIGLVYFYHVWRPAWVEIHRSKHLVEGLATYDLTLHTRGSMTTLRDLEVRVWRQPLDTFIWAPRISRSRTALGSCVKWPPMGDHSTALTNPNGGTWLLP